MSAEEDNCLEFPREVKLSIKNPYNPNIDIVEVNYELTETCTVEDLKVFLENNYPSNPSREKQRLIYFGKLLRDKDLLVNLLTRADLEQVQTFHLLVPVAEAPKITEPENIPVIPPVPTLQPVDTAAQQAPVSPPMPAVGAPQQQQVPEQQQVPGQQQHMSYPMANFQNVFYQQQLYYQQQLHLATLASLAGTGANAFSAGTTATVPTMPAVDPTAVSTTASSSPVHVGAATNVTQTAAFSVDTNGLSNIAAGLGASGGVSAALAVTAMREEQDEEEQEEEDRREESVAADRKSLDEPQKIDSYESCIEELRHHHLKLMQAIEASQRLQMANAMLLQPWMFGSAPLAGQPMAYQPQPSVQPQQPQQQDPAADRVEQADPAQAAGQEGGQVWMRGVIVINVRLIIKLALIVYFCYDTGTVKFYSLCCLAFLAYLYETGYLEWLVGTREAQREFVRRLRLDEYLHVSTVARVGPGFISDSYFFLKTFVLSMIPSWKVVARDVTREGDEIPLVPPPQPQPEEPDNPEPIAAF
uniref:Ubiquitin-like domain-containing protein n=1 Tax=Mucochytrium quahogii TaxID=96639 RepID=A0A7S2WPT3_9STRA|mmetsp:Transcript_4433/g.6618  ORF Transcript_4433/g.6618 Transcript_4433/m.6618 type:complete len:529 (+) Transcript_4433:421-2007(+)|eukprot:CAMPEP_0203745668 /NCGR_PEP_ID=MMETSP0098-20131031/1333_1 /ASSEMBLY_ACC=CAM_ASM_000208 /TAXON_ID=96639 /ORGANISM=" , Strain NY0313808BC1" /LENGTH=528 /DNA_ID=CAMNT_0050633513 /DNA_START=535 /DNA_END=2121 /DNA_ORIENTATION=-